MIQNLQVKNNLKYYILIINKNIMSKKIKCSTCKKIKNDSEFIKSENSFFKSCTECRLYQKLHYKLNKQKILKSRSNKIDCQCGSRISKGNMANHLRSKKHQIYKNNKDKKPNDYYKFWESKIDGVTYYYKSKKKIKKITCYCGFKFYPTQVVYDKHIIGERHKQFVDFISHCRPYDDEYVIYEKIVK